jgi:hypothetical protein
MHTDEVEQGVLSVSTVIKDERSVGLDNFARVRVVAFVEALLKESTQVFMSDVLVASCLTFLPPVHL